MRAIKFRAWVKNDNRMESCVDVNPFYIGDCDRLHWKHEEVVLMQYTGLKDKNGKEIYEGDIVEHRNVGCLQVTWGHLGWHLKNVEHEWSGWIETSVEVIGNIYEHPHLLEGRE